MSLMRPTQGEARLRPKLFVAWGVFAVPLLLLIVPALHYSLDTPVGLLENSPALANKFNSASNFLAYLRMTFVEDFSSRFRPFFDVWTGLVWKLSGDAAWPHHLSRWVLFHFGAAAFFIAAFIRVAGRPQAAGAPPQQAAGWPLLLPAALLGYLWLLFPNLIVVRIETVELHTIFFLGLCNWAAALVLTGGGERKAQALFCLGFLGLLLSKEVNVAPALWLLACWWAWAIAKGISARKLLVGAALTLALLFTILKVSTALEVAEDEGHYTAPTKPIFDRLPQNAARIFHGLFQTETSAAIAAAFIFLLLALAVLVAAKLARRRFDGELAFVLLVLGEFVSLFLVLCMQFGITSRYWSILVPCLATLLAFAAKFLLEAARRRRALANGAAFALAAFIAYFAAVNYYNFLYQAVVQHSGRNLDDLVIAEVVQLLKSGKYVQGNPDDWRFEEMKALENPRNKKKNWPNVPHGSSSVHRVSPKDPRQPYYFLDIWGQPALADSAHALLVGRTDYRILDYAAKAASLLQGGAPHTSLDWGIQRLGKYSWGIYSLPYNLGDYLDQLTAQAGEPAAQSVFDVYFDGKTITYAKKPCLKKDIGHFFFLHLAPVRQSDLPEDRKPHEFDNLDFYFGDYGVRTGGACLAGRRLPPYPIKWVRTGQYVMGEGTKIWGTEFWVRE